MSYWSDRCRPVHGQDHTPLFGALGLRRVEARVTLSQAPLLTKLMNRSLSVPVLK